MNALNLLRRTKLASWALVAVALCACGGSGDDPAGGTAGGAGTGATGTGSGGGSSGTTCATACDHQVATQTACGVTVNAQECLNACGGLSQTCVDCIASQCAEQCIPVCFGGSGGQGGFGAGGSGGVGAGGSGATGGTTGECGTGNLSEKIGQAGCILDSPCEPDGVCDNNTPNALKGYCTNLCTSIADCPCGANWTCEVNPKKSSVKMYCKDNNKY